MTLTDLMDAEADNITKQNIGTQLECIQNTVNSGIKDLQASIEEIESQNKDDFDSELKFEIQDLFLYGDKLENLLVIAYSKLHEYKMYQGWETFGSVDQELLTVYEELNENETLELWPTVESNHLGLTGDDLLTSLNGDFHVTDGGTTPDLDVSLSDVVDDELSITKIENTEEPVKKKIIWQANIIDVIRSGVIIDELRSELRDFKSREFCTSSVEFYSEVLETFIGEKLGTDPTMEDSEQENIIELEEIELEDIEDDDIEVEEEIDIEDDDIEVDVDVDVDLEDEELEDVE